jgi:hypothetical protein
MFLLNNFAMSSRNARRRCNAARRLGIARDARGFDLLLAVLHDENAGVRGDAAWALGELKDRRAVEPLTRVLADELEYVRQAAEKALAGIDPSWAQNQRSCHQVPSGDFPKNSAREQPAGEEKPRIFQVMTPGTFPKWAEVGKVLGSPLQRSLRQKWLYAIGLHSAQVAPHCSFPGFGPIGPNPTTCEAKRNPGTAPSFRWRSR